MTKDLIDRIDAIVERKALLTHPFYTAWSEGTLPLDSLKKYATQYFHFESAYPTFLSGLHHRCQDRDARQLLLDNLWDEEHGDENHVELWLRFCDALGVDRDDVEHSDLLNDTVDLIETYRSLTSTGPLAAGVAALYAYESQVPEVATAKLDGLSRFYGIVDEPSVSFFTVHRTLDEEHSDAEREMVGRLSGTETDGESLAAVERATDALWRFLDGVY